MPFNVRLVASLLACTLRPAFAADTIFADRSTVEAAFLYNFALFTEWPALPRNEFRICVLGSEPVFAALEPVKKKQIKDHPVTVTNISSAAQAQSCQVLFVGSTEHRFIGDLARQIGKAPVLVISEEDGYDPKDVIIMLVVQQGRIAFKINRSAAQANSLTVSSKLLKLALQVY
jgi:YfiR/HmsC-like